MTEIDIKELAEEALNAACQVVQEKLGVHNGNVAAMVFSDGMAQVAFERYVREEIRFNCGG